MRAGLALLLQAQRYAVELGRSVWDLAVEISELRAVGLTNSDVRWLVCKGYVKHARDVTLPGECGRTFGPEEELFLSKRTCLVLTEAGAHLSGGAHLNRAVPQSDGNGVAAGCGVVCGLDVCPHGNDAVVVKPGLAIDWHGNEVIVDAESQPVPVPVPKPPQPPPESAAQATAKSPPKPHAAERCDDATQWYHLVLCYHECKADPAPVLTSDCHGQEPCQPGVIRERYKLELRPGRAPGCPGKLHLPQCICEGKIDYAALAKCISHSCPPCPDGSQRRNATNRPSMQEVDHHAGSHENPN